MNFDYILVGGGLQNGLLALALRHHHPDVSIGLVERAERLGGNHTWCFHAGDLPAAARDYVEPLIAFRWPGYRVQFPDLDRTIDTPYSGFTATELHRVVASCLRASPVCELATGVSATVVRSDQVELSDGRVWSAATVIDARGPSERVPPSRAGFQTFLGLEVKLARPHGLDRPVLMDATVDQIDGFRFVYLLPFSPNSLLVEDTYFCDRPAIDRDALRGRVRDYLDRKGLEVASEIREEVGCLPLPWAGNQVSIRAPLRAGYAGGWFHPATGYSFPVALRLAECIASSPPGELAGSGLRALAKEQRKQVAYCHRLNHMVFHWFAPADRRNVFERFYRLPESLIRRFYALELSAGDRARILLGRPPRGFSLRARLRRRAS